MLGRQSVECKQIRANEYSSNSNTRSIMNILPEWTYNLNYNLQCSTIRNSYEWSVWNSLHIVQSFVDSVVFSLESSARILNIKPLFKFLFTNDCLDQMPTFIIIYHTYLIRWSLFADIKMMLSVNVSLLPRTSLERTQQN